MILCSHFSCFAIPVNQTIHPTVTIYKSLHQFLDRKKMFSCLPNQIFTENLLKKAGYESPSAALVWLVIWEQNHSFTVIPQVIIQFAIRFIMQLTQPSDATFHFETIKIYITILAKAKSYTEWSRVRQFCQAIELHRLLNFPVGHGKCPERDTPLQRQLTLKKFLK